VTTAVVLIEAERDALTTLGGAIVRVPRHEQLAELVTSRLVTLPGVTRTQTMVAFEVFSRHDLEAMFSIGS
jgi:hypothetical protein